MWRGCGNSPPLSCCSDVFAAGTEGFTGPVTTSRAPQWVLSRFPSQAALGSGSTRGLPASRGGFGSRGRASFFRHLGLAWRSPIGCPSPWKRGWHGSAEPVLARGGSSCRLPTAPGWWESNRLEGESRNGAGERERHQRAGTAPGMGNTALESGNSTRECDLQGSEGGK